MPDETMRAHDLMTTEVVTIRPDMRVASLARLLAERGISSAPVTDADGGLMGIVTEADLLRRLAHAADGPVGWLRGMFGSPDRQAEDYTRTHGLEARDVMTTRLVTVTPDATAGQCAQLMESHGVKQLPVVQDARLVGIISRADLLRAVLAPPLRTSAGTDTNDVRILAALRAEMHEQPWADRLYTFVDVQDGVVTLSGFVRSDAARRGLNVLATGIAGVVRVEDRMQDTPRMLRGETV